MNEQILNVILIALSMAIVNTSIIEWIIEYGKRGSISAYAKPLQADKKQFYFYLFIAGIVVPLTYIGRDSYILIASGMLLFGIGVITGYNPGLNENRKQIKKFPKYIKQNIPEKSMTNAFKIHYNALKEQYNKLLIKVNKTKIQHFIHVLLTNLAIIGFLIGIVLLDYGQSPLTIYICLDSLPLILLDYKLLLVITFLIPCFVFWITKADDHTRKIEIIIIYLVWTCLIIHKIILII